MINGLTLTTHKDHAIKSLRVRSLMAEGHKGRVPKKISVGLWSFAKPGGSPGVVKKQTVFCKKYFSETI